MAKKIPVGRRGFLKGAAGAAAGAAALVGGAPAIKAQSPEKAAAPLPSAAMAAAEKTSPAPRVDVYTTDRPGSDFMVDVIKSLGFEYVCANPGSSFRGLHESLVNYGGNKTPEFITCCHEESSVAMAHGYAKIEGKPMMVMAHGTVGLQHASMAIYNAYVRSRAGLHRPRQHLDDDQLPPRRRRVGAQRAGRRRHGARFHQVGRRARLAAATSPNPPCAPTRSR